MTDRIARVERTTKESSITVELNLDGTGIVDVSTVVPFFDHMLTALGSHASFDLTVHAKGDIEIEAHHTVEDTSTDAWASVSSMGMNASPNRRMPFLSPSA